MGGDPIPPGLGSCSVKGKDTEQNSYWLTSTIVDIFVFGDYDSFDKNMDILSWHTSHAVDYFERKSTILCDQIELSHLLSCSLILITLTISNVWMK
jgi:hypothetical protein